MDPEDSLKSLQDRREVFAALSMVMGSHAPQMHALEIGHRRLEAGPIAGLPGFLSSYKRTTKSPREILEENTESGGSRSPLDHVDFTSQKLSKPLSTDSPSDRANSQSPRLLKPLQSLLLSPKAKKRSPGTGTGNTSPKFATGPKSPASSPLINHIKALGSKKFIKIKDIDRAQSHEV